MRKAELLNELYLLLLSRGPGYRNEHNIEFWDPTCDAVHLYDILSKEDKYDDG